MRNTEILDILLTQIPCELIKFVILYGNKDGRDIDLCVVRKNSDHYGCFKIGNLDITSIGEKLLPVFVKNLNPLITEPILTGEVIFGDAQGLKEKVYKTKAGGKCLDHLFRCIELFRSELEKDEDIRSAAVTLTFAISYLYYIRYYCEKGSRVTTFKNLLATYHDNGILKASLYLAKKPEHLDYEDVQGLNYCYDELKRQLKEAVKVIGVIG